MNRIFKSYLFSYEDAMKKVSACEKKVLHYTRDIYVKTMNKLMEEEAQSNNGTCFESL